MLDKKGIKLEINQEVFVPESAINKAFYGQVIGFDKDFQLVSVRNKSNGFVMAFEPQTLTVDVETVDWDITYHVDIPRSDINNKEWINVENFNSRSEAIKFAMKHFGADENGMICIISQS